MVNPTVEPRWSREDVQRVLYLVVSRYEQAHSCAYTEVNGAARRERKRPRRFVLFGQRLPFLGGDSELLRDAIRVARQTLADNNWWPSEGDQSSEGVMG